MMIISKHAARVAPGGMRFHVLNRGVGRMALCSKGKRISRPSCNNALSGRGGAYGDGPRARGTKGNGLALGLCRIRTTLQKRACPPSSPFDASCRLIAGGHVLW